MKEGAIAELFMRRIARDVYIKNLLALIYTIMDLPNDLSVE